MVGTSADLVGVGYVQSARRYAYLGHYCTVLAEHTQVLYSGRLASTNQQPSLVGSPRMISNGLDDMRAVWMLCNVIQLQIRKDCNHYSDTIRELPRWSSYYSYLITRKVYQIVPALVLKATDY